jgi:hypothetical protein
MAGTVQLSGSPTFNADGSCTIDSTGNDRVLAKQAAGLLSATQGWCAVRLKMGFAAASPPVVAPNLWNWGDPTVATMMRLAYNSDGGADVTFRIASWLNAAEFYVAGANESFVAGAHKTVIGSWTASVLGISVDGGAFVTAGGRSNTPNLAAFVDFDIGNDDGINGNARQINSDVYWIMIGTGTLADVDAATIHANGDNDPSFAGTPGTPVFLWTARDTTWIGQSVTGGFQ